MRNNSFATKGDAVIVTGAAGGIGSATVENLVKQGIFVFAVDKNTELLTKTCKAINSDGNLVEAITADLTSEAECKGVCDQVKAKTIRLKGLVNNAAVGAFNMSVESTSFVDWQRVIAINLTSLYLMAKYSIPLIRSAGGGAIVNISSIHAYATSTGVAPYASAKGAVLTLTKTMALDLASDKIRVVCIIPGATDTPMLRQHAEREGKSFAELGFPTSDCAIGRIAQPEEVADVIAFALSRGASFITGSSIIPDGGILAKF